MTTYLITGGTGYIGSLLVKRLKGLAKNDNQITCILPVRDIGKAREKYNSIVEPDNFEIQYVLWDMLDHNTDEKKLTDEIKSKTGTVDYIIHCAAVTVSKQMSRTPVEVAEGIVNGTRIMLEAARILKPKHMVCLSSMEAYGIVTDIGRTRKEDELGTLDLTSARSSYPVAKRMQEHFCHIYSKEYNVPVSIARLAQTFGEGVRLDDNRVYMQFARAARDGKDIVLHTEGKTYGNYCAASDTVDAILLLLEKGENGWCYNVVNEENTMTIREMAELVADKIADGKISVKIDLEDEQITGYARDTYLRLSGSRLRALGWKAKKSLRDMYMEVMKEI